MDIGAVVGRSVVGSWVDMGDSGIKLRGKYCTVYRMHAARTRRICKHELGNLGLGRRKGGTEGGREARRRGGATWGGTGVSDVTAGLEFQLFGRLTWSTIFRVPVNVLW